MRVCIILSLALPLWCWSAAVNGADAAGGDLQEQSSISEEGDSIFGWEAADPEDELEENIEALEEGVPLDPNEPGQWSLTARNAFNGVFLWDRPIPTWTSMITVAPATALDVVLSLFDSNNVTLVNEQNSAAVGAPETITNFNISSPGIHSVQIKTIEGAQTDYAMMFMDAESYSFIFKGLLIENTSQSGYVEADSDHFWFFSIESSDSVSFRITPEDNGDPYVELYDPDGSRMLTIDHNGEGEAEELTNYTLLDGGMYGIRVAEFSFQPMSYTIQLLP